MEPGDPPNAAANEQPTLVGPASSSEQPTLLHSSSADEQATMVAGDIPEAPSALGAPSQIGGYTLVGRLGEGGMGTVYEAVQQNPRRAVALKIIRSAFADEHQIQMFEREAQALARLKHPGIAVIYESGATPDGQHYIAMELVHGDRLDQHLRKLQPNGPTSKPELRLRLDLFLLLCDAVSYAHQRGVIHRDLKPANVLVRAVPAGDANSTSTHLADAVKVLDFGLARLSEDEHGSSSEMTMPGAVQGTVPYMSPEQVRGKSDQIDVRTDVYALGVMLYELLAGRLPYNLTGASLPEAARIICEQPPAPLELAAVGKGGLGRDLAVIAGKALEKEPGRRYQSVSALAEDIRRSLNNQPILAQPPSTVYQIRKLVARHRFGFVAAVAAVLLLAGYAVTTAVAARRIASERDRANREAQVAQQVSGFLVNLFQVSKPEQARGRTITARELLDKGSKTITGNHSMDPEVRASLLDTMGDAYSSLGLFPDSQPLLQAALTIRTSLFGAESPQVAATLRHLGALAIARGDAKGAADYYQRALTGYTAAEGPSGVDVAKVYNDLGATDERLGHLNEAKANFEHALALTQQQKGTGSAALIPIRNNLAYIAYASNDLAGAEQQFRQELANAVQAYGPVHPTVAKIANNLGGVLFTEKKYAEAEKYYGQALELNRKLLGDQHPEIGLDLANQAEARDAQGNLRGAEQGYRQALDILQRTVKPGDFRLCFVETNLGAVLVREGSPAQLAEAEQLLRTALAAEEQTLPKGAWDIAAAQSELGGCLLAQGRYAAAEPMLVDAFPTLRAKLGANDPATLERARTRIAQLYQRWGRPMPPAIRGQLGQQLMP